MKDKITNGVYLKEELDFEPNLKKRKQNNSNKKGDNNAKKKKKNKVNGEDMS